MRGIWVLIGLALGELLLTPAVARETIRLATSPALSPDGATVAFVWRGDIWLASAQGGAARPWTTHPGQDSQPRFSPDGKRIAFTSYRTGVPQVYVAPLAGGFPSPVTFHSEGSALREWFPDGQSLLVWGERDQSHIDPQRLFRVNATKRSAEELIFDAAAEDATLSPDGSKVLFSREGVPWWRKGYQGSQASQIWLYDLASREFTKLLDPPRGAHSPLWQADGKGFYYVGGQSGSLNLWQRDLASGRQRQLTTYDDDAVVMPCISRDGKTLIFRHLFDLYRCRPESSEPPQRLEFYCDTDVAYEPIVRRTLQTATEVSYSSDGLELAMIAGGDLWVMDTELREPQQITSSAEEERCPAFAPDGRSIVYVSDVQGQTDIWRATRANPRKYWWESDRFVLERLTQDAQTESNLQWSPTSEMVAFVKGRGDLWVMDADGQNARRLLAHWDPPTYSWSPDGKWLTYATYDKDFNRNIWVVPVDGSRPPTNLSSHPGIDDNPVWSPNGRMIAFTGRNPGNEAGLYFVHLQRAEGEADDHDRAVQRAVEKLRKARLAESNAAAATHPPAEPAAATHAASKPPRPSHTPPKVWIDFEHIADRIHYVSLPNVNEGQLWWSADSTKLAYLARVNGKTGVYTIAPPDDLMPKLLTPHFGKFARWLPDQRLVWLASGVPASVTPGKEEVPYRFSVPQQIDVSRRYAAGFDLCWRTMRDYFYDERLNNRNWDEIRGKYAAAARAAATGEELADVVRLMLGELNGSHMGFYLSADESAAADVRRAAGSAEQRWKETTAHLGAQFASDYAGPGWKVRAVIAGSPAAHVKTRILPGEIILSVNGKVIQPGQDPTQILNGPPQRDLRVKVRDQQGRDRDLQLRAISWDRARMLLREQWVEETRRKVAEATGGKLGYLHIASMDMPSFYRFERDLFAVGADKVGLIIDVRENGGGSTTDHLLTALTQPVHAITVQRGGEPGYPQDRKVYATWNKPIVVLCNQNTYSNAEIFCHAIQTLQRGPVVGVPTAGGVISVASVSIMDIGRLRVPYRGWFLMTDGQDMDLHGAVPDFVLWPQPDEMSRGKDEQLTKAIEVLQAEVARWSRKPQADLHWASQR